MKIIRIYKNCRTAETARKVAETAEKIAVFAVYEKKLAASLNPDKTSLPSFDNQYEVPLCQDLLETTIMKFNKFYMEKFLTRFDVYENQLNIKFLSGFVRI